jgi:SH3 domain-containing YSC84-like protein 1
MEDTMYNDMPVYDERHDDVVWNGQRGNAYGEGQMNSPKRSNTWQDDVYDRPGGGGMNRSNTMGSRGAADDYVYRDRPTESSGPTRPVAPPKPNFASKQALLKKNEAVALFTFEADQPGDLGFKKGDIITVLKKTDSDNDWW